MSLRIKYTSEFRSEAVKLALSSDQSSAMIARDLGIKKSTLYNWISKAMRDKTDLPKSPKSTNIKCQKLEQENRDLKAKLKRAEQERDILKKAAAYFASQEL